MALKSYSQVRYTGSCHICRMEKNGRKQGKILKVGFQPASRGTIAICVNPECSEGRKNIDEQNR